MYGSRKKEFLFPVRVVKTFGNVQNAESLLAHKDMQIGLTELDCVIMENNDNGEKSGVSLDFGKEINASVRVLTHLTFTDKPANVHMTCGESVAEA